VDADKFVEEVFKKDGRIRYVGIVDREFHVLVSKMREGVQSLTPDESDRNFVQLMPSIILDSVEKLSPLLGDVESVTIRYSKMFLVLFTKSSYVIILSFNPDIQRPFMSALTGWMQSLASLYLTE
jgi:hypothetical protein